MNPKKETKEIARDKKEAQRVMDSDYKFGFSTNVETEIFSPGLDEGVIRRLSEIKKEPSFMLGFRLKAYEIWKKMEMPTWSGLTFPPIDFQKISYFSAPKKRKQLNSLDEVDKEVLKTFDRLGIPLQEQKRISGVAVDAIFDSVSVASTFKEELKKHGVIFCPMSEALIKYPDLIEKYLGTVVPPTDNFYAALNSAVFSDGSFCYIPKGVKCPLDLSTYFRINSAGTGQFERTLIIADEGSSVNYLEGCTAPMRDENQLHAAVVELVALDNASINYSTVQNWYSGDKDGKGGIYNFVTKRGLCKGKYSKISWVQVEAGSVLTWKYPSVILRGDNTTGEFYSVALTNKKMQADTGTKMIHIGKNSRSKIISKGISADEGKNIYRGLVRIGRGAENAKNFTQCDSLIIRDQCTAMTYPEIEVKNSFSEVEHEASTSKVSDEQLFYFKSRGIEQEKAISLLLNGFCNEIFQKLPLEFSVEAVKLLELKMESSVG